jgi:hypothetical protein
MPHSVATPKRPRTFCAVWILRRAPISQAHPQEMAAMKRACPNDGVGAPSKLSNPSGQVKMACVVRCRPLFAQMR